MRIIPMVLLVLLSSVVYGQNRKAYFPAWTSHQKNAKIYGISAGVTDFLFAPDNVRTYGMRLSLIGEGIFAFALPSSPIAKDEEAFREYQEDTVTQKVVGINLSGSGSMCDCDLHGLSAGFIAQIGNQVDGVSAAVFLNIAQAHNGFQFGMFSNMTYRMQGIQLSGFNDSKRAHGLQLGGYNRSVNTKGMQLGLLNKSKDTRGLQVGLWNINEKRKLPFINWNFKNKTA